LFLPNEIGRPGRNQSQKEKQKIGGLRRQFRDGKKGTGLRKIKVRKKRMRDEGFIGCQPKMRHLVDRGRDGRWRRQRRKKTVWPSR